MGSILRLISAVSLPLLVTLALTGCGGSDVVGGGAPAAETSAPTVNISGTPANTATAGQAYNFAPNASDSDGGALKFSVKNAPSWASFNTTTGQLSGTPGAADTGSTINIVITAADGSATASLAGFSITVVAAANNNSVSATPGNATVSWIAPTTNSNGTALTNLAGYKIYYGTNATSLSAETMVQVTDPAALSYVVHGLNSGTWYFAVSSYTTDGTESSLSSVGKKTI
jgi:hypothetical protein